MTTDLDRLIEAVETGNYFHFSETPLPDWMPVEQIVNAFSGSVDAAIALPGELLPGWEWGRMNDRMFVEQGGSVFSARAPNPARALLLATLRAYRSTREGGRWVTHRSASLQQQSKSTALPSACPGRRGMSHELDAMKSRAQKQRNEIGRLTRQVETLKDDKRLLVEDVRNARRMGRLDMLNLILQRIRGGTTIEQLEAGIVQALLPEAREAQ